MSNQLYRFATLCCCFLALVSVRAYKNPAHLKFGRRSEPSVSAPYAASIRKNGQHICSGSIISENFILTAAACTQVKGSSKPYSAKELTAYVGAINRLSGGIEADVEAVIVHKEQEGTSVALLRLAKSLNLSRQVKPIRLASSKMGTGSRVTVSGWGLPKTKQEPPKNLQTLIMSVSNECERSTSLICLAYLWQNSICNADAGGPVTYRDQLVGIAIFREHGCGLYRTESFINVAYYGDWIKQHADL